MSPFAGGRSRAQVRTGDDRLDRIIRELTDPNNLNETLEYDRNGRMGVSEGTLAQFGAGVTSPVPSTNGDVATGNVVHTDVAVEFETAPEKVTMVPDDLVLIEDSAAGFSKAKMRLGAIGGMLGLVEKVVEVNMGALPAAGSITTAHGITDWDRSKFSFVQGRLRSPIFGEVAATVPGLIDGVFTLPLPAINTLAMFELNGNIEFRTNTDFSAFQFSLLAYIGYNPT